MPSIERRWVNKTQPQTLQIGVILLYLNAVFFLVFAVLGGGLGRIGALVAVGQAAGGFGIANERKWGYWLGLAAAVFPLLYVVAILGVGGLLAYGLLNLIFEVALVALLLHPQSRDYERIWFK